MTSPRTCGSQDTAYTGPPTQSTASAPADRLLDTADSTATPTPGDAAHVCTLALATPTLTRGIADAWITSIPNDDPDSHAAPDAPPAHSSARGTHVGKGKGGAGAAAIPRVAVVEQTPASSG